MTKEKDIFDSIKSRYKVFDEEQLEKIVDFYSNSDYYSRTLIAINEFINDLDPNLDKNKIKQKTEDLLRSYPPTL